MGQNKTLSRSYTVSPIGTNTPGVPPGTAPNNGADFGADTPGTTTSGLQEALNAISSGGVVTDIGGIVNGAPVPYQLTAGVHATGHGQKVVFNGSSIIQAQSTFTSIYVIAPFDDETANNYHSIRWIGNGATIDANSVPISLISNGVVSIANIAAPGYTAPANSPPSYDCVFDGFNLINLIDPDGLRVQCTNNPSPTKISSPTYDQTLRRCVFRNLKIVYLNLEPPPGSPSAPAGIYVGGSVRQVLFEDIDVDMSANLYYQEGEPVFVRANQGDLRSVVFRRCRFNCASTNYSHIELQGAAFGNKYASQVSGFDQTTKYVSFQDCEIQGPSGYNNQFITLADDDYTGITLAYLNFYEFLRCKFISNSSDTMDILFETNGNPSFVDPFGYFRVRDSDSLSSPYYDNSNQPLYHRDPGDGALIPVGPSPFLFMNEAGTDVVVFVSAGSGSISEIDVDSQNTGLTGGAFVLAPLHSIKVTYSGSIVMAEAMR
jgi:hypothetical protein